MSNLHKLLNLYKLPWYLKIFHKINLLSFSFFEKIKIFFQNHNIPTHTYFKYDPETPKDIYLSFFAIFVISIEFFLEKPIFFYFERFSNNIIIYFQKKEKIYKETIPIIYFLVCLFGFIYFLLLSFLVIQFCINFSLFIEKPYSLIPLFILCLSLLKVFFPICELCFVLGVIFEKKKKSLFDFSFKKINFDQDINEKSVKLTRFLYNLSKSLLLHAENHCIFLEKKNIVFLNMAFKNKKPSYFSLLENIVEVVSCYSIFFIFHVLFFLEFPKVFLIKKTLSLSFFKTRIKQAYLLFWSYAVLNFFTITVFYIKSIANYSDNYNYYLLNYEVPYPVIVLALILGLIAIPVLNCAITHGLYESLKKTNPAVFIGHQQAFKGINFPLLVNLYKKITINIKDYL